MRLRANMTITQVVYQTRLNLIGLLILFGLCGAPVVQAKPVAITAVTLDRSEFKPGDQPIRIRFMIDQSAQVQLSLYDARNVLVYQSKAEQWLPAGEHSLYWKGQNQQGKPVMPEVYLYTLTALNRQQERSVYDLSDSSGGETVAIENLHYDEAKEQLNYTVSKRARVYIRAGIKQAFMVKTLLNGVVRAQGDYREPWNGFDDHRVISLKGHPNYGLFAQAYQLSDNSIIVHPKRGLIEAPQWKPIAEKAPQRQAGKKRSGLHRFVYHRVDQQRDVKLNLNIPKPFLQRDGSVKTSGPIDVTVDLSLQDALIMEADRVEIVFFLNNQLIYENEVSYFPYTWTWDPKQLPEGEYYLTALIVSFAERYGVASRKVHIVGAKSGTGDS